MNRRTMLSAGGAMAAEHLRGGVPSRASAPSGRVAVAKSASYGPELLPTMAKMFDQLGGLSGLVKGKTVAIKVNLTVEPWRLLGKTPIEDTFWVHPRVIGAVVSLLGKAGARRIRVLEGPISTTASLEEFMLSAHWEPRDILGAAPGVEFENTNYLGAGKRYSRLKVPNGGYIFDAYDLNHSYEDCDVFVSLAKLKEHSIAGVTLSVKNVFGITPCTIYGEGAGVEEPSLRPQGLRVSILHNGRGQPSQSAPQEKDASTPRQPGYRVPRITADLVAARPVHLAIIDGIRTATRGEMAWPDRRQAAVSPSLLVAGTNCVCADAVAMAAMGYDPMSDRGTPPFAPPVSRAGGCDSTLRLLEEVGVGTRDLKRIEVVGTPIRDVGFDFKVDRNP